MEGSAEAGAPIKARVLDVNTKDGMLNLFHTPQSHTHSLSAACVSQVEGSVKAGAPIKARVLDVNKKDGVVDLSLRKAHTAAGSKKAAKALEVVEASPCISSGPVTHSRAGGIDWKSSCGLQR